MDLDNCVIIWILEEIQYYQELTNSRDTALLLLALWGHFQMMSTLNYDLKNIQLIENGSTHKS